MNKLLFVIGLTGSGKTKALNEFLKTDIAEPICCDSTQFYKDIPTITNSNIVCANKHLYTLNLTQPYTCSDFIKHSINAIQSISSRHKLPLFEGGTLFYAYSLISNQVEIMDNYDHYKQIATAMVAKMDATDKKKEVNKIAKKLVKQNGVSKISYDLKSWDIRIIFSYLNFATLRYNINRRAYLLFSSQAAYKEALDIMRASKLNPKIKDILGVKELLCSLADTKHLNNYANLYTQRVEKFSRRQLKYFTTTLKPYSILYNSNLTPSIIQSAIDTNRADYEELCKSTVQPFEDAMKSAQKCNDTLNFQKSTKNVLEAFFSKHREEILECTKVSNS